MPGRVTGTLGQEDIILENAATESTLEMLVETMSDVAKKLGVKGRDYAKELKALKAETEARDDLTNKLEEEEEKRRDLNKELDQSKKKFKELGEDLNNVARTIAAGFGKVFSDATPTVGGFTKAFEGIPLVGPIFASLGGILDQNINTFRLLGQSGIDLGDSLYSAQMGAAAAGLSLQDYANVLSRNSQSLALLSGSATDGAKRFTEISRSLKQSGVTARMANLGYSMEEVSDATAGYLEIQTKLGRAQKMSNAELTAGSEQYLLELDQLARITGMTRKEAQESLKQQLADKRVKTVMAGMDEKQRAEYQKTLAALEKANPELAEGFKELVATGGIPITEAGKKFALANPEFAKAAGNFKRNNGTFEELASTVRQGAHTLDGMGQGFKDTAAVLSVTGKDMGTGGYYAFMGLSEFGKGANKVSAEQQKAMEEQQKKIAGADQALVDFQNQIKLALLPILEVFSKHFESHILPAIQKFADWLANDPIEHMMDALTTALVVGIGVMFAKAAVTEAIKVGVNRLLGEKTNARGADDVPATPGKTKGKAGKGRALKAGLKGLGIGSVIGIGADLAAGALGTETKAGAGMDVLGSAASMAGTGAMIGSIIPGLGTAVGAAIGGVLGTGMGLWQNKETLFAPSSDTEKIKKEEAVKNKDKEMAAAVEVAQTTTAKEVKELAAALKEVDYNKLIVPDAALVSMTSGTLDARNLRGEVIALTTAFKDLDNTGLDKITSGLARLDDSFKSFNKSFVEDFMAKFKELDKKSQEALLTDISSQMEKLNIGMATLIDVQQGAATGISRTAKYAKQSTGNMI